MACHLNCHKDSDTGEIFCPFDHGWVESCPLQDAPEPIDFEDDESENEEDDDDEH